MGFRIRPTPALVVQGGKVQFDAADGVGPFFFSMAEGTGTIDPATGVYQAANAPGHDVVQVTDTGDPSAPVVQAEVVVNTALKLLCGIIQTGLGLPEGAVYLWNQKVNIPPDQGLYVAVRVQNTRFFANTSKMEDDGNGGLLERQVTHQQDMLTVDLTSKSSSARDRRHEFVMALKNTYSRQQQQAGGFRVFPLPKDFVNLSGIDGAAIPYRFQMSVVLQYSVTKLTPAPSWNDFTQDPTVTSEA